MEIKRERRRRAGSGSVRLDAKHVVTCFQAGRFAIGVHVAVGTQGDTGYGSDRVRRAVRILANERYAV